MRAFTQSENADEYAEYSIYQMHSKYINAVYYIHINKLMKTAHVGGNGDIAQDGEDQPTDGRSQPQ